MCVVGVFFPNFIKKWREQNAISGSVFCIILCHILIGAFVVIGHSIEVGPKFRTLSELGCRLSLVSNDLNQLSVNKPHSEI